HVPPKAARGGVSLAGIKPAVVSGKEDFGGYLLNKCPRVLRRVRVPFSVRNAIDAHGDALAVLALARIIFDKEIDLTRTGIDQFLPDAVVVLRSAQENLGS